MNRRNKSSKKVDRISQAVVKRLPKYYRYLRMIGDKGIIRVSSQELSEITGLTASQIRQDLNHFGGFGQQGYGYNVEELYGEIKKIMGINHDYYAIIIGVGNIGQAVAKYKGFKDSGFIVKDMFDNSDKVIGREIEGLFIKDVAELPSYLEEHDVDIAVLCVPAKEAQGLADILSEGDVRGVWNFAPVDLKLKEGIVLENVHLDESLYTLTYYINNIEDYVG